MIKASIKYFLYQCLLWKQTKYNSDSAILISPKWNKQKSYVKENIRQWNFHQVARLLPRCHKHEAPYTRGAVYVWCCIHEVPYMHGAIYARRHIHAALYTHGAVYAWSSICMEPYMHGVVYTWSRICMEPYMHGAIYLWCQLTSLPSSLLPLLPEHTWVPRTFLGP